MGPIIVWEPDDHLIRERIRLQKELREKSEYTDNLEHLLAAYVALTGRELEIVCDCKEHV